MKKKFLGRFFSILGLLAKKYIEKNNPYIIGINGSVGKTSCRMILADTLCTLLPTRNIMTSGKNFNGELGMSLSIFGIEEYTPSIGGAGKVLLTALKKVFFEKRQRENKTILLLEYGIDHPGEMNFLLSICKPHISVHTQIDSVHSEQFGDIREIAKEEFLLQQHTKDIVFINQDDMYISHILGKAQTDIITYSATGKSTDTTIEIQPTIPAPHTLGTFPQSARITYNKKKSVEISCSLFGGIHMAYCAIGVCIADIISYGTNKTPAIEDEGSVQISPQLQPGRMSVFDGKYNSIIIDSTYNASPRSVKYLIQETNQRRNLHFPTRKLLFVLGDMRELGNAEQKEHTLLAQFLTEYDASLFLVGEAMKTYVEPYFSVQNSGRLQNIFHYDTYIECSSALLQYLEENQHNSFVILCKGSQNTIFLEEVVKALLENEEDHKKLTRQSSFWLKKKEEFLQSRKNLS